MKVVGGFILAELLKIKSNQKHFPKVTGGYFLS